MKIRKTTVFLIALVVTLCIVPLYLFSHRIFGVEEMVGTASDSSDIPYLGEYLVSFPSEGAVQYVIRRQMSTCVVSWAGKMSNPEISDYFNDPAWSISITKFKSLESPIEPIGGYKINPSPDDDVIMCYKPLIDKDDRFQITIYYEPRNNIFIGKAISSRPD